MEITASVETTAQTGVEMEALTAASVAALTVYDMAKAIDKEMVDRGRAAAREDEGAGVRAAVLTVSDGVSEGTREDASGDVLEELLAGRGSRSIRRVVPDERDAIADAIVELAGDAQLVLTTGGTGLGPRDVTPEATMQVLDRLAPGIAEAIRADSIAKTPHALLSRGVAGVVRLDARRQPSRLARRLSATGSRCCSRRSRTPLQLLAGETQSGHRQT